MTHAIPTTEVMTMGFSDGSAYMAWKGIDGDPRIWWDGASGQPAPQPIDAVGSSGGVALAAPAGGPLYLAWKGRDDDERIFWSRLTSPDGTWSDQLPVPGAGSSVGPALTYANGRLLMAWKGVSGDQRIWWNEFDGTTWSQPQVVAGANTGFGPALACNRERTNGLPYVYMAWKGVDGDPRIFYSYFLGGDTGSNLWADPILIPGIGTSAGVALASPVDGGGLYLAWKGKDDDQRIFYSALAPQGESWSDQTPVPGANTSVGPALAVYSSAVHMAWKGVEGDQRIFSNSTDGLPTHWTAPQPVPGANTDFRPALTTIGG